MLTETKAKNAKPRDKAYRLPDSGGLFLHVMPTGSKTWRLRYRAADGKEQTLTLGKYPDQTLLEARQARDAAKELRRDGVDPAKNKKLTQSTPHLNMTFEVLARRWFEQRRDLWMKKHAEDVIHSLERDIFPAIGTFDPRSITPQIMLATLKAIEDRGAIETAHRIRQRVSEIFVHGIATGNADTDPAAIVKAALRPVKRSHQPAITDLSGGREMIARVEAGPAHPTTLLAFRLLYLTAVRPGEIRGALWEEFSGLDGDEPLWVIPAERMKMKRDHIVPLSRAAVDAVVATQKLSGKWPHLFPNARRPAIPMSENALAYLLNRAGYHSRHVPHGCRSLFSSVMNEQCPADHMIIELMLAHAPQNKVASAYNRALHLGRRRELFELWSSLILDGQRSVSELILAPRRS